MNKTRYKQTITFFLSIALFIGHDEFSVLFLHFHTWYSPAYSNQDQNLYIFLRFFNKYAFYVIFIFNVEQEGPNLTNLIISLFLKNCTHGVPMIPAASAISGSSSMSISTKWTFWSNSSITCHFESMAFWLDMRRGVGKGNIETFIRQEF